MLIQHCQVEFTPVRKGWCNTRKSIIFHNFKDLKKWDHISRPLEKYLIFKNNWKSLKFMSNGGGCFLLIKKTLAAILSSKERGSSTKGKTEKGAGQGYCHSPRHRLLESGPRREERRGNTIRCQRLTIVFILRRCINCKLKKKRKKKENPFNYHI